MANSKPSTSKQTRRRGSRSPNGSGAQAKAPSTSRPTKRGSASKSRSSPANASRRSTSGARGKDSGSRPKANDSIADKAGQAAETVKETAARAKGPLEKAKGPAVAIGAAATGVAGGMLLKGRLGRNKRVLGVPVPRSRHGSRIPDLDVKSVAKSVGDASQALARKSRTVSRDIERVGEQAERVGAILNPDGDGGSRGTGRRSPIEVVLDGLTHRRDG